MGLSSFSLVLGLAVATPSVMGQELLLADADLPIVGDADLIGVSALSNPAYLLVSARNLDRDGLKDYNQALPAAYEKFGGQYLAVQGQVAVGEGQFGFETVALSRWPSMDAIRAYWASADYAQIKKLREGKGEFQIIAFEGLPPEPAHLPSNGD